MPPTLDKDIRLLVRDALLSGWDATQAASYDPNLTPADGDNWLPMSRGWYDSNAPDPSVAITNPESSPVGGGNTGFTGWDGTDGSLNQDLDGTVLVTVFAEENGGYNNGLSATDVTSTIASEIARAANESQTGVGDLRYLAPQASVTVDDTDVSPAVRGEQVTIGYGWLRTAP